MTVSKNAAARNLFLVCCLSLSLATTLLSCSKSSAKPIELWTDQKEFASYAELFNASQDKYQVSIVYKENPSKELSQRHSDFPDIIVAPWLKNETIRKNFMSLDFLFDELKLSASMFYPQLLELGNIKNHQYLLPISFNLPALIFSTENQQLVTDSYMISLKEIQESGANFNQKNKKGVYTSMGFSPRWNPEFLYLVSRLFGADFHENKTLFGWDNDGLKKSLDYLAKWTKDSNTSTVAEDEFKFKYLYNPVEKLVVSGSCLFGYIQSDSLFTLPDEKLENIDFRWVHQNNQIPVADMIIYLAVHKKTKKLDGIEAFIIWFLSENNQKKMLERSMSMKLQSTSFGISGGFSAIKSVNEKVLPVFYPLLFGHLPDSAHLSSPHILPARWETIMQQIILPFLQDSLTSEQGTKAIPLADRIDKWIKQN